MTRMFAMPFVGVTVFFVAQSAITAANANGALLPARPPLLALQDAAAGKKAPGAAERPEDIVRRLQTEFEGTLGKLEEQDAGAGTRDLQRKIVEDLDKLIVQHGKNGDKPPPGQSPKATT